MKNKITKWFIISCIITVAIMLFSKLFSKFLYQPFYLFTWNFVQPVSKYAQI